MIDRLDPDIAAGRHDQGDSDGEYERPLPFRSRPRCLLHLDSGSSMRRGKRHGWQS
jgi:hypothetical protein